MTAHSQAPIRLLTSADAAAYQNVRLEGLQQNPEAFGSSFERESLQPLAWFEERLAQSDVFGAFGGDDLLGVAGYMAQSGAKQAHKGVLWGMYVRQGARRSGLGKRLVEVVVRHAAGRVELLQLTVVSENQAARDMYAKLGFIEYGHEINGLKHNGRYYDEILMAKSLQPR